MRKRRPGPSRTTISAQHSLYPYRVHYPNEATSVLALEQTFTAYGEDLKKVEVLKYLSRLLSYNGNETQAMRRIF